MTPAPPATCKGIRAWPLPTATAANLTTARSYLTGALIPDGAFLQLADLHAAYLANSGQDDTFSVFCARLISAELSRQTSLADRRLHLIRSHLRATAQLLHQLEASHPTPQPPIDITPDYPTADDADDLLRRLTEATNDRLTK